MLKRFISFIISISFLCTGTVSPGMAQELFLPPADQAVPLSAPALPLVLRGMKVDAKDPLRMDFLVDRGRSALSDEAFQGESLRLIKYFLAALTIPEKDLWVNLSPYENDRIIQDDLGRTGMGRDLLAQDYILKQLTAGLLHPEGETGKAFWAEVYRRAYDDFGTTDIPVDTFNKVWIVPAKSVVYESRSPDGEKISAFVQEMRLKVMLETDYLATSKNPLPGDPSLDAKASEGTHPMTSSLAKDILREIVIPVLEKEVNEGANFALLRQVCYSLVLSVWLKKKLMASAQEAAQGDPRTRSLFSTIFVNRHKTGGIEIADPRAQTRLIYDRYVEAFKRGAYDLIREEVDTYSQELIPRKYFSGGFSGDDSEKVLQVIEGIPEVTEGNFSNVSTELDPADMAEAGDEQEPRARVYTWDLRPWYRQPRKLLVAGLIISATIAGGIYFNSQGGAENVRDTLTPQELFHEVETATSNFELFEETLFNRDEGRISSLEFLSGVLGVKLPAKLDEGQRAKKTEELSRELSDLIGENYDAFCDDISNMGVSVDDYARTLIGIILRESRGNMEAQQGKVVKTKAQARAATQVEYLTWRRMVSVAYNVLKDMPGKTSEQKQLFERVKKEKARTSLGSEKNNVWLSLSSKDEVVDPEFHFMIVAIWINHMFTAEPELMEKLAFAADAPKFRKQGITIESSVKERLEAPTTTMKDSYEKLLKEFPRIPREEVFAVLVAAGWNGGINQSDENRRHMLRLYQAEKEKRLELTAAARARMFKALQEKGSWDKKIELVRRGKKLQNKKENDLGYLYSQYHKANEMFRRQQRLYNNLKAVVYAEIVVNLSQEDTKTLVLSAEDFRDYRDSLKGNGSKDNAELRGGIDLSAQDDALSVFGRSGTFALDLSPEQLKMLDQDVQGFLPIIINVQPVKDVKMFLGFQAAGEAPVGS